jgi:hypothetical protein
MEMTSGASVVDLAGSLPVTYSTSTFPYNCVVLIETKNPADPTHFSFGSGVVIGPHTILTASHMLWSSQYQSEANQVWLYPAYNQNGVPNPPGSGAPLTGSFTWHNYIVGNVGTNTMSQSDSQYDFAVIDTNYTFPTYMNALLEYGSGYVHMTGYPATSNGIQTDKFGYVTKDPNYSLLDYPNGFSSPDNSGGPLWIDGLQSVVGIVSTSGWAAQLTVDKWLTILNWEEMDSYLWGGPTRALTVSAAGDFNNNSAADFVWSTSYYTAMWQYNPSSQRVTTTNLDINSTGWGVLGSAHYSNVNGSNAGTTQMLMDYVPTGLMTLWWVGTNGQMTGINLGQRWVNVTYLTSGQFSNGSGAGITNFLVSNNIDHHLYNWWIGSNNTLQGIDLGPYWANVSLVTAGQFTNNGGTNLLVSNNIDHHLYDWWITNTGQLTGVDLGPYWTNVAIVANGQFTANGSTNFLVTNTVDHHLYDWWIGSNGTLQGVDLGAYWSNVQLVTVGRFDNKTTNTEMLVQNTLDHHLYEWWISPQGQLTGIDLGAYWNNVQLVGNSHYNNNSAFNQLLVRNTGDGHFYEWWISGNSLTGLDLGSSQTTGASVADNSSGMDLSSGSALVSSISTVASSTAASSSSSAAAGASAIAAAAGAVGGGEALISGISAASSTVEASLPPASSDSTSLLVQSMASFGASGAVTDSTGALPATDPSQQPALSTTIEQHLAHA